MSEKYIKDFDGWNSIKKKINEIQNSYSFYEKEIWWSYIGINIGSEQDGMGKMFIRPVYILKKINSKVFLGIPLSSNLKEDYVHVTFYFDYDISTAIISQIKVLDGKRLLNRITTVSDYVHQKIKKATADFILC